MPKALSFREPLLGSCFGVPAKDAEIALEAAQLLLERSRQRTTLTGRLRSCINQRHPWCDGQSSASFISLFCSKKKLNLNEEMPRIWVENQATRFKVRPLHTPHTPPPLLSFDFKCLAGRAHAIPTTALRGVYFYVHIANLEIKVGRG